MLLQDTVLASSMQSLIFSKLKPKKLKPKLLELFTTCWSFTPLQNIRI